jgi:hypothetical protein
MGSGQEQGQLWGPGARDWADYNEPMCTPFYEAVLNAAGVASGTRLLDVGCGAGFALLLAGPTRPTGRRTSSATWLPGSDQPRLPSLPRSQQNHAPRRSCAGTGRSGAASPKRPHPGGRRTRRVTSLSLTVAGAGGEPVGVRPEAAGLVAGCLPHSVASWICLRAGDGAGEAVSVVLPAARRRRRRSGSRLRVWRGWGRWGRRRAGLPRCLGWRARSGSAG